jgi:Na+/H+ antiporter NhaD/arsenite permease-like protein
MPMGEITVSWQTLITLAAVLGAVVTIIKYYNKGYDFVKRQEEQDKIIKAIQEEQTLLTYGVLACLKGLHEQGANGPVTEAIDKIEKHINQKAHGG